MCGNPTTAMTDSLCPSALATADSASDSSTDRVARRSVRVGRIRGGMDTQPVGVARHDGTHAGVHVGIHARHGGTIAIRILRTTAFRGTRIRPWCIQDGAAVTTAAKRSSTRSHQWCMSRLLRFPHHQRSGHFSRRVTTTMLKAVSPCSQPLILLRARGLSAKDLRAHFAVKLRGRPTCCALRF